MFIPSIETQSAEKIRLYQEQQLQVLVQYLNLHSKFYKQHFTRNQIQVSTIKTLEDLQSIPPTTKYDVQLYNADFLCVDRSKIIDYVTTSGTSGEPVTFMMTENDLERLAYNEYISFCCADGSAAERYQLMTTMDRRFMAGLAYFMGIRKMGAGVSRVGPGIPELQWDTIKRIESTVLVTVPSFLLKLIAFAEANGIDYQNSSITKAICIGEPLRNADFSLNTLAKHITEKWNIQLYSTYASTEMGTAFTECAAGKGGHHHPEMIIVEFLDDNNKPVPEGVAGEVTITTLGVEGMPLLRFKTGDICYRHTEPCTCGRTTMRLGPIIGRKNQMIKFKGTTLYPPALYDVLQEVENVQNYLIEVFTNNIGTDEITIKIATEQPTEKLKKELRDHFKAKLRVTPNIQFEELAVMNSIVFAENSRKPIRFIDKRNFKTTSH
jgi:phenylacetate-CoA ligase